MASVTIMASVTYVKPIMASAVMANVTEPCKLYVYILKEYIRWKMCSDLNRNPEFVFVTSFWSASYK